MSNEATERLRMLLLAIPNIRPKVYSRTPDGPESVAPFDPYKYRDLLDAALAAERKATVERIRAAIKAERATYQVGDMANYEYDLILDAEAAR